MLAPFQMGVIAAAASASGSGKDADFSSVILLMHFAGSDGGTTFTDSATARSITRVGNPTISDDQSVFGGTSGYFDGAGDRLQLGAPEGDFNLGDTYTIEISLYPLALPGAGNWCRIITTGANGNPQVLIVQFTNDGAIGIGIAYGGTTGTYAPAGSLVANTWNRLAFSVNAGACKIFKAGLEIASGTVTAQTAGFSGSPYIGYDTVGTVDFNFNGYVDEVRITKGVARYPTEYTPPATPFPDELLVQTATKWNAADKTSGWSLSNGGLTIAETTNTYEGIRSVAGKTSGKWYWELLINSPNDGNGTDAYPGIRRSDTAIGTTPGSGNDALLRTANGTLFASGGPTAGTGGVSYPRGSLMMIALDLDSGKLWFGKNGTWNNSGDPAAGTNATFTTIPAGTWHAYCGTDNNAPKNIVTANFGSLPFTYTPPSGFSALA